MYLARKGCYEPNFTLRQLTVGKFGRGKSRKTETRRTGENFPNTFFRTPAEAFGPPQKMKILVKHDQKKENLEFFGCKRGVTKKGENRQLCRMEPIGDFYPRSWALVLVTNDA